MEQNINYIFLEIIYHQTSSSIYKVFVLCLLNLIIVVFNYDFKYLFNYEHLVFFYNYAYKVA